MSATISTPREIDLFLDLAAKLRDAGFAISPDLTIDFLQAITLLGPRHIDDVREAALSIFSIRPEDRDMFEAIFRGVFYGQTLAAAAQSSDDEEETDILEVQQGTTEIEVAADEEQPGQEASTLDQEGTRLVSGLSDREALERFGALAPLRLPKRDVLRRQVKRKGDRIHLRQTLKDAAKYDGEIFNLQFSQRKQRQRPIVFLIDVSGSMQEFSASALRFAHKLVQVAEKCEVFSLGTRMTRLTPSLKIKNREIALARSSSAISDFDGGTRLGSTISAFLSVPRYASLARGAWTAILSDGLERDRPDLLADASARLGRMSWRLSWLTPLGAKGAFKPQTQGLKLIEPSLDALVGAPDLDALCDHFLSNSGRI